MDRRRISLEMLDTRESTEGFHYQCHFCGYLLHDTVQISCGHWICLECAKQLFTEQYPSCPHPDCVELLTEDCGAFYFPDHFVRRTVARLAVLCVNNEKGCNWTGQVRELENHLQSCEFSKVRCKHCADWITPSEQKVHLESCPLVEVACPLAEFGCRQTTKMTRSRLASEHLAGNGLLQHVEIMARCMREMSEMSRVSKSEKGSALASLQNRVNVLEDALKQKSSENDDRDFRLSLVENSNFDGTMIWKIPMFFQRVEDARSGKHTSVFSLPFYSSRYGYKMCLRMYPLGDGIGRATHMSLFFVVMKGEFDDLLQWPFTHVVTFKLFNLTGGRDVTDQITPDPLSRCFQKPTTDMNVAMGCPRFIDQKEFLTGGFIVDGTVYIKVMVDTSNMQHP